jgi:predicted TIM-barrel fold metal-dependent hydrolase
LKFGGRLAGSTKPASPWRAWFSRLFDRHPDFKIITHHMGAMIPYFEGRRPWLGSAPGSSDEKMPAVEIHEEAAH